MTSLPDVSVSCIDQSVGCVCQDSHGETAPHPNHRCRSQQTRLPRRRILKRDALSAVPMQQRISQCLEGLVSVPHYLRAESIRSSWCPPRSCSSPRISEGDRPRCLPSGPRRVQSTPPPQTPLSCSAERILWRLPCGSALSANHTARLRPGKGLTWYMAAEREEIEENIRIVFLLKFLIKYAWQKQKIRNSF